MLEVDHYVVKRQMNVQFTASTCILKITLRQFIFNIQQCIFLFFDNDL